MLKVSCYSLTSFLLFFFYLVYFMSNFSFEGLRTVQVNVDIIMHITEWISAHLLPAFLCLLFLGVHLNLVLTAVIGGEGLRRL